MSQLAPKFQPSPIISIRERLVHLKASREKTISSIEQLEAEKNEIEDVLPKLLQRLIDCNGTVDYLSSERDVYDESLERVVGNFGVIIDPGSAKSQQDRVLGQGEEDYRYGGPGEEVIRDLQVIASRYKKENPYAAEEETEGEEEEEEEAPYDEEKERREYMHDML